MIDHQSSSASAFSPGIIWRSSLAYQPLSASVYCLWPLLVRFSRRRVKELAPEDVLRCPTGHCFVRASLSKGILPEILEELLGARKRAKADLKAATNPFMKAVLDGRQLALKACNFLLSPPMLSLASALCRRHTCTNTSCPLAM